MAKNINLMAALADPDEAKAPTAAPVAEPAPVAVASSQKAKATKRRASGKGREGLKAITTYLDPAFDLNLAEIQHRARISGEKKTREELMAEALNLLFRKHKMPVVGE